MTDFQKGQTVTFAERVTAQRAGGYGDSKNFARGDSAEVTTVRKDTITVRVDNPNYGQTSGTGYFATRETSKTHSYNVPRSSLNAPNGEAWTVVEKPKPRKIGEVPEGGIAADDPRIAHIWEDAGKLATRFGYCNNYDQIVEKLGAPGRERDIYVSVDHKGLQVTATVKARSEKEAKQIVLDKLTTPA
ncbi:hypothetical protein SEA_BIG4_334 [Microbacterium phage Big4]|nr:hypothetical protein SEA_BIG4_8 [Microbacterium phage Big4]URP22367.1 hypothetical protein SEA_BIG4_334 [Microbacterium phage Big4]